MRQYIAGFCKTEHFTYRQWDRKIDDKLLHQILKNVEPIKKNTLLIVSRKFLKRFDKNFTKELFIKIDRQTLITCFFCEINSYRALHREQQYLIINDKNFFCSS